MRSVPRYSGGGTIGAKRIFERTGRTQDQSGALNMRPFNFIAASEISAAATAGERTDSRFVAGGTTLLDLMKLGVETPATLIDINPLASKHPELSEVNATPSGGVRIGALARMSDVAWNDDVRAQFPMVSQALLLAASGQIRNMATVGGNIMQRTRCYYFRDTASPCNKREPGTGCSALNGVSRIHAILGTSNSCIATHASDLAIALVAVDAVVHVVGKTARTIPFADFHLLPEMHPERETTLRSGELITAIEIPPLAFARNSVYLKIRDRASFAFALASAAVALDVQQGRIRDARVALGGVGTRPWRSREAESALIGQPANDATFDRAAVVAVANARTTRDNAFKVQLARRTLVRALTQVAS